MSAAVARPNPVQWLAYVAGRRLPDELQDWVRRDLTRPHSAVRQVVRGELVSEREQRLRDTDRAAYEATYRD